MALWLGSTQPALAQDPPSTPTIETSLLDTLHPVSRQQFEMAQREEAAAAWRKAEAGYQLVLRREPRFVPAILGLGRVRAARGDRAGAIEAYERLPAEAEAVEALAALVEEGEPARAAELYERLARLRPGSLDPYLKIAHARARAAEPGPALQALQHWMTLDEGPPEGAVVMAVAAALREAGQEEELVALLEAYLARNPEDATADEARGRLDRIAVERLARVMALGGAMPLPPADREILDRARRKAAAGDPASARDDLRELVRRNPRSAEARAALGDVYALLGEVALAEQSYTWATALEPDQPDWHVRLGLVLADRYGGRRHREAGEALMRARSLRPDQPDLLFHLGRIRQELGQWEDAIELYRQVLRIEPKGTIAEDSRQALQDLTRQAPEPTPLPEIQGPPPDVPAAAYAGLQVARVYLDRGKTIEARAELLPVLKLAPDYPEAINLEAVIRLREGDEDGALATWERSLELEPDQPRLHLAMGELFLRRGDKERARALLQRAARGGVAEAHYPLADMAFEEGDLALARDHLDAFFAATTISLDREPALALQREVLKRIRQRKALTIGIAGLLTLGILVLLVRKTRTRTLAQLVERQPEAAHEVARVLSAIRHEVIKHNTTLLDEVALALESGDHHAVAFAATRLYGDRLEDHGVVGRFERDVEALRRIGRRHGMRLDLRRKDPVLGPMGRAMKRLRALERDLRRPWKARSSVPARLRQISGALNREGYRALGELLRRMGTTEISTGILEQVDARVRAEPALADETLPPLWLSAPEDRLPARIFPGDLEDVLANLLRNAATALVEQLPPEARRLGLVLQEEDDPITGIEHVVLRILDNAPGRLSTADIHGREIGRGLGLTADLVARHEGSITVEHDPAEIRAGWTKAVVVRLRRAESAEEVE